jgi:hypothetical protein
VRQHALTTKRQAPCWDNNCSAITVAAHRAAARHSARPMSAGSPPATATAVVRVVARALTVCDTDKSNRRHRGSTCSLPGRTAAWLLGGFVVASAVLTLVLHHHITANHNRANIARRWVRSGGSAGTPSLQMTDQTDSATVPQPQSQLHLAEAATAHDRLRECRHTHEDAHLVADDRGFVCTWDDLNWTSGCCSAASRSTRRCKGGHPRAGQQPTESSSLLSGALAAGNFSDHHACAAGCCARYAMCVSCCLSTASSTAADGDSQRIDFAAAAAAAGDNEAAAATAAAAAAVGIGAATLHRPTSFFRVTSVFGLVVRAAPSTSSAVLGQLRFGQVFLATATSSSAAGAVDQTAGANGTLATWLQLFAPDAVAAASVAGAVGGSGGEPDRQGRGAAEQDFVVNRLAGAAAAGRAWVQACCLSDGESWGLEPVVVSTTQEGPQAWRGSQGDSPHYCSTAGDSFQQCRCYCRWGGSAADAHACRLRTRCICWLAPIAIASMAIGVMYSHFSMYAS